MPFHTVSPVMSTSTAPTRGPVGSFAECCALKQRWEGRAAPPLPRRPLVDEQWYQRHYPTMVIEDVVDRRSEGVRALQRMGYS